MTESNDNRRIPIGHRHIWGGTQPFALRHADRRQHLYVLGQSGTGKSTLLKNILIQDIADGQGCALIDAHGDLVEEILDFIPPWRTDDVVYFNPADLEYPIAYNILAGAGPDEIHLLTSSIVGAFKSVWSFSWGVRMEYLLYASIAALAECNQKTGNVTLLGVQRMLVDSTFRRWVLKHVDDVAVTAFWTTEFENYDRRFLSEIIGPVQNKIGALLMSPPIRNTLGQVRRSFDPRFIMDNGRIFLANLSKGRLGEEKANLLGSLLIGQFEQAALSRAAMLPHERRDFWLFIDEFQNYVSDSFAGMLAESRKYALGLTLSHQHTGQLRLDVLDAIFGNCGTIISFRVGEKDAEILARQFGHTYTRDQFSDLANFEVLAKLLDEGFYREPFRGRTMPPVAKVYGRKENLIARSRERYATPRSLVEDRIRRWMKG
jgi:TraM recognition site of TraD and TraG/Type IV secretion-system coupling protein DNA-binding domain